MRAHAHLLHMLRVYLATGPKQLFAISRISVRSLPPLTHCYCLEATGAPSVPAKAWQAVFPAAALEATRFKCSPGLIISHCHCAQSYLSHNRPVWSYREPDDE